MNGALAALWNLLRSQALEIFSKAEGQRDALISYQTLRGIR